MFDLDVLNKPVDLDGGEWVANIDDHPSMRLKVRSRLYKAFQADHTQLLRGYQSSADAGEDPAYKKALGELLVKHILLGWENAITSGGKDVPFDKKTATEILSAVDDRRMGDQFRVAVLGASIAVERRHRGIVEAIVGN